MQEEEVSNLKYMTIEEMEEAYKNKDEKYSFIKWDKIDDIIKDLKEIRKNELFYLKHIY